MLIYQSQLCGYGGIGRHAGFRFLWATVQVRPLLPAPKSTTAETVVLFSFLFLFSGSVAIGFTLCRLSVKAIVSANRLSVAAHAPLCFTTGTVIRSSAGRCCRDQTLRAIADQICTMGSTQCLRTKGVVLRIIILKQCPLKCLVVGVLGHIDRLHGVRIQLRIEHTGGDGARGGIKVLHLLRANVIFL